MDFDDPALDDETSSDVVLATMELGVDAAIAKHVGGHALLLWEDGAGGVDLDEGFIILDGEDVVPMYLNAGKMYVPFGQYESHFISDPLTLEIGETNESALKVGFANDWIEVCLAAFNGDVDEAGDDDRIDDYEAAVVVSPQLGFEDFGLTAGLSYISNIGESDGLEGETPGALQDDVPGLGGFVSVAFQERFFIEFENTTLAVEYLRGFFENDDEADVLNTQIGIDCSLP